MSPSWLANPLAHSSVGPEAKDGPALAPPTRRYGSHSAAGSFRQMRPSLEKGPQVADAREEIQAVIEEEDAAWAAGGGGRYSAPGGPDTVFTNILRQQFSGRDGAPDRGGRAWPCWCSPALAR